ncbi:MAG TPA: hypothetical protein VFA85_18825 [Terriglobales bacterium]|nr:hypothetical protein [Terriglobales bacterium]
MMRGTLLISLDFELFWGVRDHSSIASYGANILGARKAIPAMLEMFRAYRIHATWATVGFLFFRTKSELLSALPAVTPEYSIRTLSPYSDMDCVGKDEDSDPYHFGRSLIDLIRSCPGQEVGTHTFSHYYCCESGQTLESFRYDLEAARRAASLLDLGFFSLVFPRNQADAAYLDVCREVGLRCYRGNEASWLYKKGSRKGESQWKRMGRLLDAYVTLSGHNTYAPDCTRQPINLPSSRFLRPYSAKLAFLDELRKKRITSGIKHAAETGEIYHLWWHPHNFGAHLEENLSFLQEIFQFFTQMRELHGMQSQNMSEVASHAC